MRRLSTPSHSLVFMMHFIFFSDFLHKFWCNWCFSWIWVVVGWPNFPSANLVPHMVGLGGGGKGALRSEHHYGHVVTWGWPGCEMGMVSGCFRESNMILTGSVSVIHSVPGITAKPANKGGLSSWWFSQQWRDRHRPPTRVLASAAHKPDHEWKCVSDENPTSFWSLTGMLSWWEDLLSSW